MDASTESNRPPSQSPPRDHSCTLQGGSYCAQMHPCRDNSTLPCSPPKPPIQPFGPSTGRGLPLCRGGSSLSDKEKPRNLSIPGVLWTIVLLFCYTIIYTPLLAIPRRDLSHRAGHQLLPAKWYWAWLDSYVAL